MNAIDVLRYGHGTVLTAVEGLPEADWNTPGVCGIWSTRQIIAHLASFEQVLVDALNGFLEGGPTPALDRLVAQGLAFNDAEVDARADQSVAASMEEYVSTQERTMELIARVPEEVWRRPGTLPWYGAEYALDDMLVYAYYGHKREHCAQIAVFRDRLQR